MKDLTDLWADAQRAERLHPQAQTKQPVMKNASPEAPKKATRETWILPENWRATKVVTLIHEESRTLLGNYQEFLHKSYSDPLHTRKLLRVEGPCVASGVEYVSGWIGEELEDKLAYPPQKWETEREVLMPELVLEHLGVSGKLIPLRVCLSAGFMARAELIDHTRFASPDGKVIATLPRGVNVLEVMDTAAKIALREELAK